MDKIKIITVMQANLDLRYLVIDYYHSTVITNSEVYFRKYMFNTKTEAVNFREALYNKK